jgi:hypothetical protein
LEIIVPMELGGGTDTLARFIAPYLGEELGGVNVIIRNVPGGGTITGINQYVNRVEPHGSTLLMSSSSGSMAPRIGLSGIEFGYEDITPLAARRWPEKTGERFAIAPPGIGARPVLAAPRANGSERMAEGSLHFVFATRYQIRATLTLLPFSASICLLMRSCLDQQRK